MFGHIEKNVAEYVKTLLNRYLKDYIDQHEGHAATIRSSLLNGEASLSSSKLKSNSFLLFGKLIELEFGRIDSLKMNLPWFQAATNASKANISYQPCPVSREGVYLSFTPMK